MKQALFFITAFTYLLALSCSKEANETPEVEGMVTLTATIEDCLTKTDYTVSGSKAIFEWSTGDQFGRLVHGSGTNYSVETYTATSVSGNTGSFTGATPANVTSYAIYPINSSQGANVSVDQTTGNNLYITLPSSITYNHDHPLKDLVPMIGRISGSEFVFYPLTGVIGVHVTNIPASVTNVSLSTTGSVDGLSGKSVKLTSNASTDSGLDGLGGGFTTAGLRRDWMDQNNAITLSFEAGSFTSGDFYFPVPHSQNGTGQSLPYTNFTITFKAGGTTVKTVSATGLSLMVPRGQIVMLPEISFPAVQVGITGTSTAFSAYVMSKNDDVSTVKVAIAATADAALTAAETGTDITAATTVGSSIEVSGGLSTSGEYYLGYKAYNSVSTVIASGTKKVYYLSSADNGTYSKQYTTANGKTDLEVEGTSTYEGTMTLAASNNPTKGNLMISELFAVGYTNVPVYGIYTAGGETITFKQTNGMNDYFKANTLTGKTNFFYLGQAPLATYDNASTADNDIVFSVSAGPTLTNTDGIMVRYTDAYFSTWNRLIWGKNLVFN